MHAVGWKTNLIYSHYFDKTTNIAAEIVMGTRRTWYVCESQSYVTGRSNKSTRVRRLERKWFHIKCPNTIWTLYFLPAVPGTTCASSKRQLITDVTYNLDKLTESITNRKREFQRCDCVSKTAIYRVHRLSGLLPYLWNTKPKEKENKS